MSAHEGSERGNTPGQEYTRIQCNNGCDRLDLMSADNNNNSNNNNNNNNKVRLLCLVKLTVHHAIDRVAENDRLRLLQPALPRVFGRSWLLLVAVVDSRLSRAGRMNATVDLSSHQRLPSCCWVLDICECDGIDRSRSLGETCEGVEYLLTARDKQL